MPYTIKGNEKFKDVNKMKDKELLLMILTEKNDGLNKMTFEEIAKLTGYHTKSLIRINRVLKKKGTDVVKVHGNLGKKKHNHDEEEKFIVEQWGKCHNMNILSFCKYYNQLVSNSLGYANDNLKQRSYSYIYNILISTGIMSPLRHNSRESEAQPIGDVKSLLILKDIKIKLLNATRHLTVYLTVDVISNQVMHIHLSQKDNKTNYYVMLKKIIKSYGMPENIYAHGQTIFRAPKNNITQFHRMCKELKVNIFLNYDKNLQKVINMIKKDILMDLPGLLSTKDYKSIKEINYFLKSEYILTFNNVKVKNKEISKFRPFENDIFENILCEKYKRKIVLQGSENNVQFRNVLYHIEGLETKLKRGTEILVYLYLNGDVKVFYNEKLYEISVIRKISSVKGVVRK